MFIKWKYNDHGHPDFKELEIPDDFDGESCVEDYICERGLVPTWSERFMASRIKWEKLERPSKSYIEDKIKSAKSTIKWKREEIKRYEELLTTLK